MRRLLEKSGYWYGLTVLLVALSAASWARDQALFGVFYLALAIAAFVRARLG